MIYHPMRDYCYIAIDWGETYLKAFLCCMQPNQNPQILDELNAQNLRTDKESFEALFCNITEKWREEYGLLPIILSGKFGQPEGWLLPPDANCPVAPADLVSSQYDFNYEGHSLHITPSLRYQQKNTHIDTMRCHQVRMLGWLYTCASHRNGRFLVCLPGIHTKWILVKDGMIIAFKTAITGEVFEALSSTRFVASGLIDVFDEDAFVMGVKQAFTNKSEQLIQDLFCGNIERLCKTTSLLTEDKIYLQGMLIGSDVCGAISAEEWNVENIDEVIIIGESQVSKLYEQVIHTQIEKVQCFHAKQATVLGFASIRRRQLSLNYC